MEADEFELFFILGKLCDCKSLHWKFSDKRCCDGMSSISNSMASVLTTRPKDCGHSPMQHTCFWNTEILTPIQKNGMIGPGKTAFKKLKILLDRMMLRRTKVHLTFLSLYPVIRFIDEF